MLSTRGRLLGAAAVALVLVGLGADRVDVLGLGLAVCALLFVVVLGQYPAAIFIWRRSVELAWRVERPEGDAGIYPGRALSLSLELRSRAPRALGQATLRPIASPALEVAPVSVQVAGGMSVRVKSVLTPRAVGPAMLHGAVLEVADPLGLTLIEAYFPSPIGLTATPRLAGALPAPRAARVLGPERAQRLAARLAGQGGELRELREHRPGDPWKHIAWKATARRGRLMVREMERETQSTHLIVLDASGFMRDGALGRTPLDVGVELCARYARTALDGGDQIGLAIVDGRVTSLVPISDRPQQRRAIVEALTHAYSWDEEATDISDAELCATVGRYLLMQEGVDARVAPPPIDDPLWARLIAAPTGELYELSRLVAATWEAKERMRRSQHTTRHPRATDSHMSELRAFCRDRAIPLPPRLERGRGVRGIVDALASLRLSHAPDRVLVVSLFDGLEAVDGPNAEPLRDSLAQLATRLRRRGARGLFVAPMALTEAAEDPVDRLLELEHERRQDAYDQLSQRIGTPIRICTDALRFRWPKVGVPASARRAA